MPSSGFLVVPPQRFNDDLKLPAGVAEATDIRTFSPFAPGIAPPIGETTALAGLIEAKVSAESGRLLTVNSDPV